MLVPVRFNVQFLLKIHWIIYVYCLCHSTYDSIIKVTIWDKEVIYLILKAYWGVGGEHGGLYLKPHQLRSWVRSWLAWSSQWVPGQQALVSKNTHTFILFSSLLREYLINFCLQTYLDKTFNVLCLHKWKRISSTFLGQYGCWFLYNRVS